MLGCISCNLFCQMSRFQGATWSLKTGHQVMHFAIEREMVEAIRIGHLLREYSKSCRPLVSGGGWPFGAEIGWQLGRRCVWRRFGRKRYFERRAFSLVFKERLWRRYLLAEGCKQLEREEGKGMTPINLLFFFVGK